LKGITVNLQASGSNEPVRRIVMNIPRRQFLRLATGAAVVPAFLRSAQARPYPSRPVRIVSGFAAGSAGDIVLRVMAPWLSERLGQSFFIENRPGAAGNIGTEIVARAPADGYTLLVVVSSSAINATLYDKLSFNFIRDIAPVATFIRQPYVMTVNPATPAKTLREFIAYAKGGHDKFNMASPGIGTGPHVAGELFRMMSGVDMVHVPYRGAQPALTDLIAGQVQVSFLGITSSIDHIRNGKLRPLAVTAATRSETLPDVPTIGEVVPGYEANTWVGLGAPRDTPVEIVDRLNREISVGLNDPMIRKRFTDLGSTVFESSPAEFGRFMAAETEKWGKVIRTADIKPD
jgi:tripartite-type tricarboxylate transporter receptor subunit TctC